jgi:proteic killer suppression protein
MIQSWKSLAAKAVFEGRDPGKGFPADPVKVTARRLERLNGAVRIEDLRSPPSHRLHKLSDDRAGQWSISVNDQFRICFVWGENGPENVEFVDYH